MKNQMLMLLALLVALAGFGCGDSGGEVTSEAGLAGVMEAIALDFAEVLADIAPDSGAVFLAKGLDSTTGDCPEGGTATWSGTSGIGAQGTLSLDGCTMRGVVVSGSLVGFLFQEFSNLSADGLRGQLMLSGGASGDLNVQRLIVSAQLPIADATTFWQIEVLNDEGDLLCAWSGGGACPMEFF